MLHEEWHVSEGTAGAPWARRIAGVTDLCDHPQEASSVAKVSRSRVSSDLTSAQVEARMQELRESGEPAFELDWQALAQQRPCLVLTQRTCDACDPSADAAFQVGVCMCLCLWLCALCAG